MTYTGYPQVARNKDDVRADWEMFRREWHVHNYRQSLLNEIGNLLYEVETGNYTIEEITPITQNPLQPLFDGFKEYDSQYIARTLRVHQILDMIDYDKVGSLKNFFETYFKLEGDEIVGVDDDYCDFFYNENGLYPTEPEKDEERKYVYHSRYYLAYGGPTIYMEWTFRWDDETNSVEVIDINYCYGWWTAGGSINLKDDEDANDMFYETRMEDNHHSYINDHYLCNSDFTEE